MDIKWLAFYMNKNESKESQRSDKKVIDMISDCGSEGACILNLDADKRKILVKGDIKNV